MSNPTLVLWCDATRNRLIQGWQTSQLATKPVLKQGDSIGVELHWVSFNGTGLMQEVVFPPSSNVTLAIGKIDEMPTGGAFTLSYNGDTTVSLANNATATEIAAALNDLASITAEGGVTVERVGITNRIVWDDPGAYTSDLTCDPDGLSPTTNSSIIQLREGTTAIRRILLFSLKQAPIAACTTFTTSASPTLTISSIYTKTWRIKLNGQPKGGSFKVVFQVGTTTYKTDPLSLFASSSDIAIALNTMLSATSSNFTTVSSDSGVWDVTAPASVTMADSTTGSVVAMSVESDIIPFSSLYGLLDMNTANVEEFLSGSSTKDAILEVEIDMSGEIQTIAQTPVTLINDIISQSVFELVSMGQVMPVDSVVRWDTPQTISSGGQLQARDNIGAAASDDIAALQAADIALDGRVDVVEGYLNQSVKTTATPSFAAVSLTTNGITFADATVQTSAFIASSYLSKSGNLSGLASVSTARTNLGLGTMAVETATDYLTKAGNLSGLASVSSARTNLGLGTMALETATNYLTTASATSTYLTISNASSTYALLSSFNQSLKTTDSPSFDGLTVTGATGVTFSDMTSMNTRPVDTVQANGGGYDSPAFETIYPYEIKVQDNAGTWYWVSARPA